MKTSQFSSSRRYNAIKFENCNLFDWSGCQISYKKTKKQHLFAIFSSLFGTFHQVGNISKNVYFKNYFWHFLANFKAVCTRIKKRVGEFISMAKILRKQRAEQLVLKDIMQKYWRTLIMID